MFRTRIVPALLLVVIAVAPSLAGAPRPADYPFTIGPDQAFAVLAKLEKSSGQKLELTADEQRLFAAARDNKLGEFSFADACLIASGVTDHGKRTAFLAQIDAIEKKAREAVANAKTEHEKGEMLLKFLHPSPMAKGYSTLQTDLHTLLDEGKFNCVSSAALYNIIGRRLGLDLRAVEIPGHVFSVMYINGKPIDVETTNAEGFDPKDRAKVKKPDGEAYDPVRHAGKRREIGELGLAAIIAYNHGVTLSKEGRFHEAVMANFRALCLDRKNPGAINNAQADLTNGSIALAKAGKFEEALNAAAVGLELVPDDSSLRNNTKAIWTRYAESTLTEDAALAILRRAATALPKEDFEHRQAFLFITLAEELVRAKRWEEALLVVERGLKKADAKPRIELAKYRGGLFLRWSKSEFDKHEYDAALAVLKRGMNEDPKDSRFRNNILAIYDSRAKALADKKDVQGAVKVCEEGLRQLPGDKHLQHNLEVYRRMKP